ncbi:thiopeptide-type bacteriocin biosynthesis protein [Tenacibaculum sp. TC6]|uniref:thiopeptide-type bacteriocin biosynthesis protein n=1 Tax=Tenacibaculum sp. TC6 TaxID=3423223 RepID=UPI003D360830
MKRSFIIGEEWIYYKIYCGSRTSDTILTEVIKPLTENLLRDKIIDKWFFIRYTDPENHLRVRFHCSELSNLCKVIEKFKNAIKPYVEAGLIWNIKIDTYQREIERYGVNYMIDSESLFFIDSEACTNALSLIYDDEILFLFALRSIDNLLSIFQYNIDKKVSFFQRNKEAFKKEFNADKKLNRQLNLKYQSLRDKLEQFMSSNLDDMYLPLLDLLRLKKERMKPIVAKMENIDDKLLSNYIHMIINRFFRDKQRLHELVCYDFLYRYCSKVNSNK